MNTSRLVPLLLLSLGLFACPGTTPPPDEPLPDGGHAACTQDTDCSGGKVCCGGTCIDTKADVDNCGACGVTCTASNGTAACTNGTCSVSSCAAGHADCDGAAANGCEVDVRNDLSHCGACGQACALENATAACSMGMCSVSQCTTGFADCNGGATDGCEVDTQSDEAHCGACNNACGAGEACTDGACVADYLYGFGGETGTFGEYTDTVWRYSLSRKAFEVVPTQGLDAPGERAGHVGAFDSQGNRMIVWGGTSHSSSTFDSDVWALDFDTEPASWQRISPKGTQTPRGRMASCAGYDSMNRVLYLFGGMVEEGTWTNDLWKFDLTTETWTLIDDGTEPAPAASMNSSCAFRAELNQFVVYGGAEPGAMAPSSDLWVRDVSATGSWQKSDSEALPGGRYAARFVDGSSPLALFGGMDFDASTMIITLPDDLHTLAADLSWTEEREAGASGNPPGRTVHGTAVLGGRLYVFGGWAFGSSASEYLSDLWEYDPAKKTWTQLAPSASLMDAQIGLANTILVAPR